jgi:small-conductance mechanosensitive channel
MELAKQLITQIYDETPMVNYRLMAFENFSFIFHVRIHFDDIHTFREPMHEVNCEIVKRFNENGIEFAAMPHFQAGQPEANDLMEAHAQLDL